MRARRPTRREFLACGIGAFAVAVAPAPFRARNRLVRRTLPVMGTVGELAVVHRDEGVAHRALDAAVSELRRVEGLMTRFRDDSDVGRANLLAGGDAIPVSAGTADVVGEALRWAEASGGAFDPALGRAAALWDVVHRDAPPRGDDVRALAGRELWRTVEVDRAGSVPRLRIHAPDASLDLGGIAKGYGVDRAAEALRDHGVFHALVNVGGDLRAMGTSEDGDDWEIGVRSPRDPSGLAATLRVADAALATSGDYLRFFRHGGRTYHHLLDPASGEPRRTGMRTLTIVADTCLAADAAATTAFGMDGPRARRILAGIAPDARVAHRG